MIKNYIKTAYRSLLKNKGFTILNVLGLSVGLATCLLIVFYVVDELSYDRYNTKAGRIYRISIDAKLNGNAGVYATSEAPWKNILKSSFPQVENVARLIDKNGLFLSPQKFYVKKNNGNILERNIVFTESSLFDVFTLPMIDGNAAHALDEPNTAVITESTAKKYFNKVNVTGRTLTINDSNTFKITGVIKDIPAQSQFHYDFFLSFSSRPESKSNNWGYAGLHTYLLLKPGTDVAKLEKALTNIDIKNSYNPSTWTTGDNHLRVFLKPLADIHLRDADAQYTLEKSGNIQYVYIFLLVAIFILLIACVNFMNLSTARSSNRAREVGVRKVLGSARKYLVAQFLTESVLVTFVSAAIALFLAWMLLPLFNQMADKHLEITPQIIAWLLPALLLVVLIVGFLAGSYPAFYLSSFQPIDVLKGKIAAGFKGGFLRSFLVIFQFAISIFLIIGTLVIYNQLNYIRNKDLGFDRDQVLVIKNANTLGNQAKILKNDLKQLPGVANATLSSYQPTGDEDLKTGLFPHRKIDIKEDILTEFWSVDEDFINTMNLKLTNGRNFSKDMSGDTAGMIVNEAFVRKLGQLNPLNKDVYRYSYGLQQYHIIGVVKDFNFASLRDNITPLAMVYDFDNGAISVKLHSANLSALMAQIAGKWKELSPNQPFTYSFMDQDFDATYRTEQRFGSMFISFSTLAIIIACLGLFGLAAYAAEQRTKEIGIRKVLGANISTIVAMLSMDFIKLVFISILIATPIAWWAMQKWLQDFAYRTTIQWYILAAAGATAITIAFITISFQSIKAALSNPINSLRSE
ncbi:putative ABC transport system permease protein [Mucilaginibacter frigoritolerans]|uniref:Putative ABC transport system permease protein n=1 Tax=Mucilaginibacter frigoritolerans TaxID=652788 RepID=A0A562UGD6_9SPHI|nr:ABC transporter permease [Mucilaginibacter frigoritolerans]TWJ04884.1 putative ABC transport system permease protein [Mucilaginibacter frigoritolerans]